MQILQPNDQTRKAVVTAYQSATVPIGWVLRGSAGIIFSPSAPSGQKLFLAANVLNWLNSISSSTAIMVMGNSGLAVTQGIFTSTYQGTLSDDYASASLLQGVTFVNGPAFLLAGSNTVDLNS